MKRHSRPGFRVPFLSIFVLMLIFIAIIHEHDNGQIAWSIGDSVRAQRPQPFASSLKGSEQYATERLDLSERMCRAKFPDLFQDIHYAAKNAKFTLKKDAGNYKGLVQGRIQDNQVCRPQSTMR